MYIKKSKVGTFWIRLDSDKTGWYGLGKDEEWLGSYPTVDAAVKEVNKLLPAGEKWETVVEWGAPDTELSELAA